MSDDLIKSSAREIRAQLKNKAVSNAELLDVLETRIDKIDPIVNALPTLCFDRARQAIATRNHQDTALLVPVPIRLTTYSASPETRGTQRCRVPARPEDRQWRSRQAWRGLPVVQIWAGHCETLPASVESWDLGPALAGSRPTRATWRFIGSA